MKQIVCALVLVGGLIGVIAYAAHASGQTYGKVIAFSGNEIPSGYRNWRLISVAHEEGTLNDFRAILGNDVAFNAAQAGKLPYPDGSIIARLAWNYVSLPESEKVFGHLQSFVAGQPKNGVQFMVRDSRKYASTGGWGFEQFNPGNWVNVAMPYSCYSCHEVVKIHDFVFNSYAP